MTDHLSNFQQKSSSIAYVYYGNNNGQVKNESQPIYQASYSYQGRQDYNAGSNSMGSIQSNKNYRNYQNSAAYQPPAIEIQIDYQSNNYSRMDTYEYSTKKNYSGQQRNFQQNNNYQYDSYNGRSYQQMYRNKSPDIPQRENGFISQNKSIQSSNQPSYYSHYNYGRNMTPVKQIPSNNYQMVQRSEQRVNQPLNNITNEFGNYFSTQQNLQRNNIQVYCVPQNTNVGYPSNYLNTQYTQRAQEQDKLALIQDMELPLHETKYFGEPEEDEDMKASTVVEKISSQEAKNSFTSGNTDSLQSYGNRISTFSNENNKQCDFIHYNNGYIYEGEVSNGLKNGFGILSLRDGTKIYSGEWKDDQFHGQGILNNISPKDLRSSFNFSDMNPVFDYWKRYEGEFNCGKMDGIGFLFLTNEEKFNGKFSKGVIEGEGSFYKRGGKVILGVWSGNELFKVL